MAEAVTGSGRSRQTGKETPIDLRIVCDFKLYGVPEREKRETARKKGRQQTGARKSGRLFAARREVNEE